MASSGGKKREKTYRASRRAIPVTQKVHFFTTETTENTENTEKKKIIFLLFLCGRNYLIFMTGFQGYEGIQDLFKQDTQ